MKMFRSSALIEEIRKKRSLWDCSYKQPSQKGIRATQWSEVAEALIPNWNELNANEKSERVEAVKRKWKHIRDYYYKIGSKNCRGKQYVYCHLLEFLEENRNERISRTSSIQTEESDIPSISLQKTEILECQSDELTQNESLCSSEDNMPIQEFIIYETFSGDSEVILPESVKPTMTKRSLQCDSASEADVDYDPVPHKKKKRQVDDECIDADRCFLLSLLPEMRNMTGLQKNNFKISVLNELSSIMREQQNCAVKEEPYS